MTYWARSNSFEFDDDGERAIGAKIYFFDAGTSTPRATYSDAALSVANAHPVVADGNGRWPKVFLQYGSYKETATTAGGSTLWTTDDIPNPEPTDPGDGVDANAIFQTGDIIFVGKNGTRPGFVRSNGRTIGSAASSATERANADCDDLFAFIWDNYANGQAAVSGGRGASAAADFAANKTIALPDYRGASVSGFDDMGNSAAGNVPVASIFSGSAILSGSVWGANTHTLLEAQLPVHLHSVSITSAAGTAHTHGLGTLATAGNGAHTHSGTTGTESATHTHTEEGAAPTREGLFAGGGGNGWSGTPPQQATGLPSATHTHSFSTTSDPGNHTHTFSGALADESVHTHSVSGNTGNVGSGSAHNNIQRSIPVTVLMKL